MTTLRDAARRRLELNPITTSLNVAHQAHLQTPNSAISSNSLSAPFGYNPATFTPVSAVRQYNPQQWSSSPSVTSADAGHYQSRGTQDAEVVTPAPPPYSPPRSNRTSAIVGEESSNGGSPAGRLTSPQAYRSSPEPASNPVFPPPPNTRSRASSNDRPPSLFSSFARRPAPEPPRQSSDVTRESVLNARRPAPIAVAPAATSEDDIPREFESRPPAARRAVSAGATSTPSSAGSRASSSTRWEPGMPLPPPPPGPPPASRSQSMTRTTDRVLSPPTRRPAPISTLGPVPPTPAGWVEEATVGRGRSPNRGLHIDTSSISSVTDSTSGSSASASGLSRARAVRGEPKSIRERRTESKSRRSAVPVDEPSNNPWAEAITPADIVVPSTILGRRPTITRSTPRSGKTLTDTPKSGGDSMRSTPVLQSGPGTGSRGSTPRPLGSASRLEAPTPPFSPGQIKAAFIEGSATIPPMSLPTPPPQSRMIQASPGRPISHILHMPNGEAAIAPPLVPSRPGSRQSVMSQTPQTTSMDQFARAAIERHQAFAQREAMAKTDGERVRIFADFIVNESRLRRDRYASAIDEMGSEILELTRDLFRPYKGSRRESNVSRSSVWTPESSSTPQSPGLPNVRSHRGSIMTALTTKLPPSEPSSGSGPVSPALARPESTWWSGYMPSLSPIPSMSVSTALDESDSRGRPSSRWWEVSDGSNGTPSMKLERSKRESKYMGMPRELREALQYENSEVPSRAQEMSTAGSSIENGYGPNEYPPEKIGWHEETTHPASSSLPHMLSPTPPPISSPLLTPDPSHLDVSRLVTLPPPYPRHHPAVNNNHPELTSIRTLVRVLSDFTEVENTKSRFQKTSTTIQESLKAEASKRRNSFRASIQRSIEDGTMSYADAAAREAEAASAAHEKEKEAVKADFDMFQSNVVIPINDLLMDRIARSSELFEQLRSKLFVDAQEQSPNLTQEEGDEQPELLEKLTLLKWIFEAREQMHKELYDLLSDRNDRYKEMVITPYRLSNNTTKLTNAQNFFAEDASKRALAFEQEVLARTEEFMDIIETNVVRGVEVQLSAFWDIAPSLSLLLQKIPESDGFDTFNIQIPSQEYDENPSYWDFPLQYLESLLGHCEKSSYQFIESQINLLCLLHEVKGGVTKVNCRLMCVQRVAQGEGEDVVERELKEVEGDEERRLTDDLKEKVRCVEELWGSALGDELKGVRTRIKEWLQERGGWNEEEV